MTVEKVGQDDWFYVFGSKPVSDGGFYKWKLSYDNYQPYIVVGLCEAKVQKLLLKNGKLDNVKNSESVFAVTDWGLSFNMDDYEKQRFGAGNELQMEFNSETGLFVMKLDDVEIARRVLRSKTLLPILGMYHEGTKIAMT